MSVRKWRRVWTALCWEHAGGTFLWFFFVIIDGNDYMNNDNHDNDNHDNDNHENDNHDNDYHDKDNHDNANMMIHH